MKRVNAKCWWLGVAMALLVVGCGDTAVDGNGHGDTSGNPDIIGGDTNPVQPGETCWTDVQCTGGLRCVGDGLADFICGEANVGGQTVGGFCVINSDCELNACQAGFCEAPKPDDNPNVIVGTGGTCSWIDSPEDCMDWKCYYESGKTICRHNDQGVPNGNFDWTCVDSSGNTLCTYSGDAGTTDPGWTCDYSTSTNTTSCFNTADIPEEGDPTGWICEFPESGGGVIKVCEMEGGGPAVTGCDVGNVEGYACTPSLDVVSGATITVNYTDCNGAPATTVVESDSLGYFVLANIPAGAWSITISKGPYTVNQEVSVTAGQTTSFTEGDPRTCFDPEATKIAVVGGAYDAISDVLDTLGFEYDYYQGINTGLPGSNAWQGWRFMLDANALNAYDIVYINCGVHPEADFGSYMAELQTIGQNLRNFVDSGHYIYASDWAYYFVESAYPDKIDFRGTDDLDPATVLQGKVGLHAVAVTDVEMQAYTGISTTTIDLNLPQWAVPASVATGVKTYLRGDAALLDGSVMTNVPFLVDFRSGQGSAAYTSYHIHENESVSSIFAFIALNFK